MNPRDQLLAAIEAALREARRDGYRQGLQVAERIRGWLTRQPDTPRQAETRQWADRALAKAWRRHEDGEV